MDASGVDPFLYRDNNSSAAPGTRPQPAQIYQDTELRLQALKHALYCGDDHADADDIVKRAERFLAFLTGKK